MAPVSGRQAVRGLPEREPCRRKAGREVRRLDEQVFSGRQDHRSAAGHGQSSKRRSATISPDDMNRRDGIFGNRSERAFARRATQCSTIERIGVRRICRSWFPPALLPNDWPRTIRSWWRPPPDRAPAHCPHGGPTDPQPPRQRKAGRLRSTRARNRRCGRSAGPRRG